MSNLERLISESIEMLKNYKDGMPLTDHQLRTYLHVVIEQAESVQRLKNQNNHYNERVKDTLDVAATYALHSADGQHIKDILSELLEEIK